MAELWSELKFVLKQIYENFEILRNVFLQNNKLFYDEDEANMIKFRSEYKYRSRHPRYDGVR